MTKNEFSVNWILNERHEVILNGELTGDYLIAVDSVGAGINEEVLITTGSSARLALLNTNAPCDAVIVGIID